MSTTYHVSLDVRGALEWPDSKLRGLVGDEEGNRFTPAKVREWLEHQLSIGREVLPFGRPCSGFDFAAGCPGHPAKRRRFRAVDAEKVKEPGSTGGRDA